MSTIELGEPPILNHSHVEDLHCVQFYKDDGFLIRSVAKHLASSLSRGGAAIAVASEVHLNRIGKALALLELSPEDLGGRYIAVNANEALSEFMRDGMPDAARFSAFLGELLQRAKCNSGADQIPIAAFGEMVAVLWAEGKREAAVQLGELWNDLLRQHPFSLLCAYPLSHFSCTEDSELFSRICSQPSSLVPAEDFAGPVAGNQHAREIAELQQRAEALAREVEARRAAEAELRAAQAELELLVEQRTSALRNLSLQLLNLQDTERRRIARELHDCLGQQFVGLKVNLGLAKQFPEKPEFWNECDQLLQRCIDEVRTLSYLLHPPMIEDAGFASAAEWYIENYSRRSGMKVEFSSSGDLSRLPEHLKLALFRILQESLTNIYRHARAKKGSVRISRSPECVSLEIEDNGVGIPRDKLTRFNRNGTGMGVGLTGMRERIRDLGGKFELETGRGGTLVRVSVPTSKRRK